MKRYKKTPKSRFRKFHFEVLEERQMRSATPNGVAASTAVLPDAGTTIHVAPATAAAGTAGTSPSASLFSPSQLRTAYGLPASPTNANNGSGETIALIEAYDDVSLQSDLNTFDQYYGLPALSLEIVKQSKAVFPTSRDWAREQTMDVEWAHAIAPGAKIEVFQACSGSDLSDLMPVIDMARNDPKVSVISMSFSHAEQVADGVTYDSHFTTPNNHQPITFIASSGDSGYSSSIDAPMYPAASPNVLGVGGTTLKLINGTHSETAWNATSGGASHYESKPSYQSSITISSSNRMTPDVAFDADLNTGVNVYQAAAGGWTDGGGMSLGAPAWAGIIAIANQERNAAGQMSLGHTVADLYSFSSSDFNDVKSGSNADYSAKMGYDLVTGLGSPKAQNLIPALVKAEPNQVYKLPGGGYTGGTTTTNTTTGNATVGGSTTHTVSPADPPMVDQVFGADSFHSAPQVDDRQASRPLIDFDMLMNITHDNDDADQMVDSLFHGRGLGHART